MSYPKCSICDRLKRVMVDGFNRKLELWRHVMIASFLSELLQAFCRLNQHNCSVNTGCGNTSDLQLVHFSAFFFAASTFDPMRANESG